MPASTLSRLAAVCSVLLLVSCGGDAPSDDGTTPPPPAEQVRIISGNSQVGLAGTALPVPLLVQVLSADGSTPVVGRNVTWTVQSGGGTLAEVRSQTDGAGAASARWTLGAAVGAQTIRVTVQGLAAPITFTATAQNTNQTQPVLVATVSVPANYGHHDTFVRDGLAFVCAWNSGVLIYDVGNGMRGGSPANPVLVSSLVTNANGVPGGAQVHNAWWFHNPVTREKRYLFIGQEGPATVGASSSGDLHVVDVSNLDDPREVATLRIDGAGIHNFWMDEQRQVLYAAYYNGGVLALDVSGTLQGDLQGRVIARRTPGGDANTYVWGVMLAGNTLYASDMLSGFWALDPVTLVTRGGGSNVADRYTSDLWIRDGWGYTGTWGTRGGRRGNVIKVWQLAGNGVPTLVDSVNVGNITTVSDVAVTPDGKALVATAEGGTAPGLYVYDRADPRRPQLKGSVSVSQGLHTGEVAVINGRTYVFTAQNPGLPALRIYDITGVVP
jgi:hypothetical protein